MLLAIFLENLFHFLSRADHFLQWLAHFQRQLDPFFRELVDLPGRNDYTATLQVDLFSQPIGLDAGMRCPAGARDLQQGIGQAFF